MGNNKNGFGVLEVLIVVVVIGLVGVLGWTFLNAQKDVADDSGQTATVQLKPEDVTAKLKNNWEAKYTLLNLDENNQPKEGELSVRVYESSPAYKVDGYDFYVSYNGGSGIYVVPHNPNPKDYNYPKTADTALRNEIADVFQDFGLSKTGTLGEKDTGTETDVYTGEGLICTIEPPTAPTSSNTGMCGLISAYPAAAEEIKPMTDVIPGVSSSTAFGALKVTDSPVSGYQKANLGMGDINGFSGSIALLYRKDSGPWQYFKNVQNSLPCSAYSTLDLRNAFNGEACGAADGSDATVK